LKTPLLNHVWASATFALTAWSMMFTVTSLVHTPTLVGYDGSIVVGTTSSGDGEFCLWYDGEKAAVRGDGEGIGEDHQEVLSNDWWTPSKPRLDQDLWDIRAWATSLENRSPSCNKNVLSNVSWVFKSVVWFELWCDSCFIIMLMCELDFCYECWGLYACLQVPFLRIKSLLVKRIIVGFGIITFLSLLFSGAVCNVSAMVQKRLVQYLWNFYERN
jgi:hypothetical protein